MIDCETLQRRNARDFRWIAVTGPIEPSHYDESIGWLFQRAKSISGVVALYDLGPVRFPGLSDIDLLFVLRDDFSSAGAMRGLLRASVPGDFHDVLLHDPYFVRARELPLCFKFAPFFELNSRWQIPDAELPSRLQNDDPIDLVLFLLDIVVDAYPWEFVRYLSLNVLDEREVMSRVKGLAYCFDLLDRLGVAQSTEFRARARAFTGDMLALRGEYFTLESTERQTRLLAMTQRALILSQDMIDILASHLRDAWGLRLEGDLLLARTRVAALFTGPPPTTPRVGSVSLRRKDYFVQHPVELGYLIHEYIKTTGPVTDRLRAGAIDRLLVKTPASQAIQQAIRQRAALRNAHQAWLDQLALGLPGFMTFGYRTRLRAGLGRNARLLAGRSFDRGREVILRKRLLALRDLQAD